MKKKEDARNVEKTRFPVKFDPNLGVSPRCLAAYHGILNTGTGLRYITHLCINPVPVFRIP